MTEQQQAKFEGWAVVEMMGHQREVGYVTTEVFGAACLFRVDTPALPERDYELKRPEWILAQDGEQKYCPAGSKVRRQAVPAKSRLVGPPAIYAITPCTEESAMRAIEELIRRPVILLELPPQQPQLAAAPEAAAEAAHDEGWTAQGSESDDDRPSLDGDDDPDAADEEEEEDGVYR